jgi:NTE family protein
VLGAGGVVGAAWLAGGLEALEAETGWNPARAERIVGTSAGSLMGSLLAAGEAPWRDADDTRPGAGDRLADAGERPEDSDRSGGAGFSLVRGLPWLGPGSPRLALSALLHPSPQSPMQLVLGLMPQGLISTADVEDVIRRAVPSGWVDHPGLWVVACDYDTGEPTAFGRPAAPPADLADAVAASCAIPSFYHPKTIAGRRYVDGGLHSGSNLDVLVGEDLDLVICLNPTSSRHSVTMGTLEERASALMRSYSGRRLGSEAKRLRATGTEVVLVQPTDADLEVMPTNLMSRRRRREVYETARRTVAAQVRAAGLRGLLGGEPARGAAAEPGMAPCA